MKKIFAPLLNATLFVHNIMVLHRGSARAVSSEDVNRFMLHFPKPLPA